MAILRTIDHFFGLLEVAQKYARLSALDDRSLAARGLTRDTLGQSYVADLAALDQAAAAPRPAAPRRVHAAA